jgi:hypothetical protein
MQFEEAVMSEVKSRLLARHPTASYQRRKAILETCIDHTDCNIRHDAEEVVVM